MRTIYPSVFKKPEVVNELRRLHDNFVLVPADKASNNIVFVCKNYYYECLLRLSIPQVSEIENALFHYQFIC
jgi:hypothetical protein